MGLIATSGVETAASVLCGSNSVAFSAVDQSRIGALRFFPKYACFLPSAASLIKL